MALSIMYQNNNKLIRADTIDDIPKDASFIWFDFEGANEEESELFKQHFEINGLTIEDVIHSNSRPKYKNYRNYEYLVYQKIEPDTYEAETINVLLKDNIFITYHAEDIEASDEIDALAKELEEEAPVHLTPRIAAMMLLDKIVDFYTETVESIEDKVLSFEKRHAKDKAQHHIMDEIFELRSKLIRIKGIIVPMSELVDELERNEQLIESEHDHHYIHHIQDHMIKQKNIIKNAQELTDEIRSNYESYNNYRMNRVMQILTLVSTVFLPLTLIAGIYGMNFEYMPELKWKYGYFTVLIVMAVMLVASMIYFKKKKWY
ncbi:magnesium/cobalt transporter CorA [Macrococcoides caseolyticum]|uniref:magnesium/cobalt transporter CorA n=1 Tax=Macrococcoides caseolyticum TaxID=69966 RepID=UPI001F20633E|nr:magnesium/cobalt transporter CorA [Macrococcus caseolyticus]MCE4957328.1 magnesium/cobalt transporter CorA [Macrococcus caseolyticus]